MEKLDYESFKDKMGAWALKFKPFIEGKEMWDIYQTLKKDAASGTIVPKSLDTFRAFRIVDPRNLKVLFYLQDPYPRAYKDGTPHATGLM